MSGATNPEHGSLWYKRADGQIQPVSSHPNPPTAAVPPGTISSTGSEVAPPGWLFFGQTYSNGEEFAEGLWLVAPAAWKVGADLVLPDMSDRVCRGDAVGATTGQSKRTITLAQIPAHTHTTTAHVHAVSLTSAGESAPHTHGFNHGHSNATSGASIDVIQQGVFTGNPYGGFLASFTTTNDLTPRPNNWGTHIHTYTTPAAAQASGNPNVTHTHAFTGGVSEATEVLAVTGGAVKVENRSASTMLNWMVKA